MSWLQLVYRLPTQPSRKRIYVWRQLRGMGAVYLQDCCCMLPRTPDTEQQLTAVAAKVREFGGDATLSVLAPAEPGWEERMVALVNRARDEEYQELVNTIERLEDEIARETKKGKFTFAALEEVEDELDRLQRWLGRVQSRDLFSAPSGEVATTALVRVRSQLETFQAAVYERERALAPENGPADE